MSGCGATSQRQINNGALLDVEFVTVTLKNGNVLNSVDRDVLVQFKRPHKFIMLVAITNFFGGSNVFVHFSPLGFNPVNGSDTISATGGEQWIPLGNQAWNPGKVEGRWIRFNKPISQFWIDADHPAGQSATPYLITFMGSDDIDAIVSEVS